MIYDFLLGGMSGILISSMATYKVIQDVEADDKLVGPLSVRQFVYAAIAGLGIWLSFMAVTKGLSYALFITVPVVAFTTFFAFPWGGEQPTELWALAKIRFMIKPRKRIWNQSHTKELVTINVPKKIERVLTNGLTESEVQSRLSILADTIDSRGWAIKNANVNEPVAVQMYNEPSDRLVPTTLLPQQVSDIDIRPSDDVLDPYANPTAQTFQNMLDTSKQEQRQYISQKIQAAEPAQATPIVGSGEPDAGHKQDYYWFTDRPSTIVSPEANRPVSSTAPDPLLAKDEDMLTAKLREANSDNSNTYGNMKTIAPIHDSPDAATNAAAASIAAAPAVSAPAVATLQTAARTAAPQPKAQVTPERQAAIINAARNNDQTVATIANDFNKSNSLADGVEVDIPIR